MSIVHDTFVLERTYPAAPERVFAAWATTEAKRQWFGEDDDIASTGDHTLDFRIGGREQLSGKVQDGTTFNYDAVYQDIVDNERIVWSYDMHLNGQRISVSLASVQISPAPGGATLVLTEHGAYLDGLDTREQREEGTIQLLDKLGEVLAAQA